MKLSLCWCPCPILWTLGWWGPRVVSSITIIVINGEFQLESLLCCHYWNDGLACSHCVNGQIGRPAGDGERMANYYNGMSWQAIVRQRSMWILSGWKRKRGNKVHLIWLLYWLRWHQAPIVSWITVFTGRCDLQNASMFRRSLKAYTDENYQCFLQPHLESVGKSSDLTMELSAIARC